MKIKKALLLLSLTSLLSASICASSLEKSSSTAVVMKECKKKCKKEKKEKQEKKEKREKREKNQKAK